MNTAALGFRTHSGWAVLVVVSGARTAPAVIERRRVQLADSQVAETFQPYHAAQAMGIQKAQAYLDECAQHTLRLADTEIGRVLDRLAANGYRPAGAGLLLASGKPLGSVESILASHALIHAAEGEFFRNAIRRAIESRGLPVMGVRERELFAEAAACIGLPKEGLDRHIAAMGKSVGSPWRQDEKYAAVAAWLALARSC